jgi:hypothetical protein
MKSKFEMENSHLFSPRMFSFKNSNHESYFVINYNKSFMGEHFLKITIVKKNHYPKLRFDIN